MFSSKKIFRNVLFLFSFFFLSSAALAQEEQQEIREAEIIAEIGVYNTQAIQRDSEIFITFDLENNGSDQSGVNYKIKLYQQGTSGKPIALIDEIIGGAAFDLKSGELLKKEFVYNKPFSLDGTYQIWVEVGKESGVPLAAGFAKDIVLEGENNYIFLGDGACHLSVGGENFSLLQGVDASTDETLSFVCDSRNLSNNELSGLKAVITTYERSTVGKNLGDEVVGDISFAGNEKKTIILPIKIKEKPQGYGAVIELKSNDGQTISNKVELHYITRGASASIHGVKMTEKENGVVLDVNFAIGADDFTESRKGPTDMTGTKVRATLRNVSEKCSTDEEEVDSFDIFASLSLGADDKCGADLVLVEIVDKNGKVLATDKVLLDDPFVVAKQGFDFTNTDYLKKVGMYVLIALILIVLLIMLTRNKNKGIMMLAFMMLFSGFVYSPEKTEAATIYMPYVCQTNFDRSSRLSGAEAIARGCKLGKYGKWMYPYDNGQIPVVADEAYTSVNINKNSCYMPGEDIDVTASGWVKAKCGNGAPGWVDVTVNGERQRLVSYTPPDGKDEYTTENFLPGSGTFTAPSSPGAYTADFVLVNTHGGVMSRQASINYTVCNVDVNATCGSANGGNFQTAPTSNLCGDGDGLSGSVTQNPDGSSGWSWTCAGSGSGTNATCSTNSCSINYGSACESNPNVCGATSTGVLNCAGTCVESIAGGVPVSTPDVRDTNPTYGTTETSSPNACGMRSTTRGTCTEPPATPTPPPTSQCPAGPVCVTDNDPETDAPESLNVPAGGIINPVAIDEEGNVIPLGNPFRIEGNPSTYRVGSPCLVENPACPGTFNESYVTCDGTCAVGLPVCNGKECISRGNVNGKTNRIFIEQDEQCEVIVPSDSVCEIPSFGFRTKNGLYTVDPGTEKTLVWDTVLNATYCSVKRADGTVLTEINNYIRDTSRPQPGHEWTNILPSGEIETGPIEQTTEYIMTCINVTSPEVKERLRITLTPNIFEN